MWRDQINSKEITVRCWKVLKNYNEKINSRILSRIRNTDAGLYNEISPKRELYHGCLPGNFFNLTKTPINKRLCLQEVRARFYPKKLVAKSSLIIFLFQPISCHRSLSIPLKILEKIGYATFCTCFISPFLSFNV